MVDKTTEGKDLASRRGRMNHVNKTKDSDRITDECCYQEAQRTVTVSDLFSIIVGLSRDLVDGGIH